MPVYTDKTCFWHIHKTGGTWVRQACKSAGVSFAVSMDDRHLPTTHLTPKDVPEYGAGRFNFTVVRDPFDWLRSWYCSREKEQWTNMQGPSQKLHVCRAPSFAEFIAKYLDGFEPDTVSDIFWEYERSCDVVIRLEDQPTALVHVLNAAGEVFDPAVIESHRVENPAIPAIRATCDDPGDALRSAVYEHEQALCRRHGYGQAVYASGSAA